MSSNPKVVSLNLTKWASTFGISVSCVKLPVNSLNSACLKILKFLHFLMNDSCQLLTLHFYMHYNFNIKHNVLYKLLLQHMFLIEAWAPCSFQFNRPQQFRRKQKRDFGKPPRRPTDIPVKYKTSESYVQSKINYIH